MPRFIVRWDYHSDAATYQKGQVVDLDADFAAWLQRDSRGVLEPIVEPQQETLPETRVVDAPAQDRQVKKPRGARGEPQLIDRSGYKAVRDKGD